VAKFSCAILRTQYQILLKNQPIFPENQNFLFELRVIFSHKLFLNYMVISCVKKSGTIHISMHSYFARSTHFQKYVTIVIFLEKIYVAHLGHKGIFLYRN